MSTRSFALLLMLVAAPAMAAPNLKTVCGSGCTHTSLQAAIDQVPDRTAAGSGAASPWTIRIEPGVVSTSTPILIQNKSYLTITGRGDSASILRATTAWFTAAAAVVATGGSAERLVTIRDSDHVSVRAVHLDALSSVPLGQPMGQANGVTGVYLERANPVRLEDCRVSAFQWGVRDASPPAGQPALDDRLEIHSSRIFSQHIAAWATGGTTWLVYGSDIRGVGDLTENPAQSLAIGLRVTGSNSEPATNRVSVWGTHFHGESESAIQNRGVEVSWLNDHDIVTFVGCTLHGKSGATEMTGGSVVGFYSSGGSERAKIDITGSDVVYEAPPSATSGSFAGVLSALNFTPVNLVGTAIVDLARDDSVNPPLEAGGAAGHSDIWRIQGWEGPYASPVRVVGTRAARMTGDITSPPQSINTVEMQAGTATLVDGAVQVNLPAHIPSNKYRVVIGSGATESYAIYDKTSTSFKIKSSDSGSKAVVDWVVRY